MPVYTQYGPFVNGASPGLSAGFFNAVETQLSAVQYGFNILAAPYQLTTNAGVGSGATNTYTCTGGSTGVTAGAKAVYLNVFFSTSAGGTAARFTPHGTTWAAGLWPQVGESFNATNIVGGSIFTPVDSNGQIDVLAHGGTISGMYIGILGFIY